MKLLILICVFSLIIIHGYASPLKDSQCFCRESKISSVSVCTKPERDPQWCEYHVCAPGYECVGENKATHVCEKLEKKGMFQCLRDSSGAIIHPNIGDDKICKCRNVQNHISKQVLPRLKL